MVALVMDDCRGLNLFDGVTIEAEDPRHSSQRWRVGIEIEDSRCNRIAIEMEDPRCRGLSSKW
jgi:hypothetical protein